MEVFKEKNHREYYSNKDYIKVGGLVKDIDNCILEGDTDSNKMNGEKVLSPDK